MQNFGDRIYDLSQNFSSPSSNEQPGRLVVGVTDVGHVPEHEGSEEERHDGNLGGMREVEAFGQGDFFL